jgi:uroporphyrinogen decarboxylase
MRNRRDGSSMPEFLEHPVKTEDDWERLKAQRLRLGDRGRFDRQDWGALRKRLAKTGEAVQVGVFPYGVFGTPRDLLGAEELLVAFYDRPALVRDMMAQLTSLWISIFETVASEVQIDHIHIWEDMAGRHGSLISPEMVEAFMMPCYRRIARFGREAGVRIISVDTDGDCAQLVAPMMAGGMNMMFPFEAQAGNDILEYRRRHPSLGIMCGLDKRALAGTRRQIDREIDRCRRMIALGRYVPGFDHLIPPDVPWDHFAYAMRELKRACGVQS